MEQRLIDANSLIRHLRAGLMPIDVPNFSRLPDDQETILDYINREPTVDLNKSATQENGGGEGA